MEKEQVELDELMGTTLKTALAEDIGFGALRREVGVMKVIRTELAFGEQKLRHQRALLQWIEQKRMAMVIQDELIFDDED